MPATPTLRQLQYFITLSETHNFTQAAELCFVGQSTLSAGLKELEEILHVQLFERDRQNVSLTPIGKELIPRAKALLAGMHDLIDFVNENQAVLNGTLKLGIIPTIAPFLLPQILPKLRQRFPNLKIALREDLTANLLDKLHSHQLDFAIIALPYATDNLLVKELFEDAFWLTAQAHDPALKNEYHHLPNKLTERLLLLEEGHCLREHSLRACKSNEIASNGGIEATSLLTLIQMIESGMGIALIPEIAIQAGLLQQTKLVAKRLTNPSPKRTIAMVARTSSTRLTELGHFIEIIQTVYRSQPT